MSTTQQVGGSSSQTHGILDPNVIELAELLKPLLRVDYSSAREGDILIALCEIGAHVISEVPDQLVIKDTLDEFSIFPLSVDDNGYFGFAKSYILGIVPLGERFAPNPQPSIRQ